LKTEIDQNSEQYMLLLEARKEAEQSNILKTEFLRNMEHEVRTPLNGIIGFTELLVLDKDNQKAELYKEYIQSSVYRLLDIMEKIIDYSRIQAGDIKITYTKTNIQEVLDLVIMKNTGKALQRRNKLHQMKTSDSVEVDIMIDVEKLTKMVEIVTENAIKFTFDGKIDFSGSITGKNLAIICIQDNGIGIPEEEAKNIFEPFRQVEIGLTRDYGGNGLGLAIAKAYADAMGGEIKIISTLGHGTRVEVSIPFNSV
jgi:signal transduction histidine kinase